MNNGRTTIFTSANKPYIEYISLYCLGMLRNNDNVDIEILIEGALDRLSNECIEYLRSVYKDSKIIIRENRFSTENRYAVVDGHKVIPNSVRFVVEPTIRNEFVYIGDIDVVCMEHDIFESHRMKMAECGMKYSNIARITDRSRLTGLHFCRFDLQYPLPNIWDLPSSMNDEQLLKIILERKGVEINYEYSYRPVHGIHMSKNRKKVDGDGKIPGWGADAYKDSWISFTDTNEYKFISQRFVGDMNDMIKKLEIYYGIR